MYSKDSGDGYWWIPRWFLWTVDEIQNLLYFISKEQSSFSKNLESNLLSGKFLTCFDIPENYAFIVQNAAQSFISRRVTESQIW